MTPSLLASIIFYLALAWFLLIPRWKDIAGILAGVAATILGLLLLLRL